MVGHTEWEDSGLDVLEWGVIGGDRSQQDKTGGATLGWDLQAGSNKGSSMVKGCNQHDISFITLPLGYSLFYLNQDRVEVLGEGSVE